MRKQTKSPKNKMTMIPLKDTYEIINRYRQTCPVDVESLSAALGIPIDRVPMDATISGKITNHGNDRLAIIVNSKHSKTLPTEPRQRPRTQKSALPKRPRQISLRQVYLCRQRPLSTCKIGVWNQRTLPQGWVYRFPHWKSGFRRDHAAGGNPLVVFEAFRKVGLSLSPCIASKIDRNRLSPILR